MSVSRTVTARAAALPLDLPLRAIEVADAIERMLDEFWRGYPRPSRAAYCVHVLIKQIADDYRSGRATPHRFSAVELREAALGLAAADGEEVPRSGRGRGDWFAGAVRGAKALLRNRLFTDPQTRLISQFSLHETGRARHKLYFALPDFTGVDAATEQSDAHRGAEVTLPEGVPPAHSEGSHTDPAAVIKPQLRSVRPNRQPPQVATGSLVETTASLVGRAIQLAELDQAWTNPNVRVFGVTAFAGSGKTALLNTWLRTLEARGYAGAERVFAWSFYRAGKEALPAQSDEFLAAALLYFGSDITIEESPWARAERLASLICDAPSIIILDGIDAFQRTTGALVDEALRVLLRELAARNPGLCVLTSRYRLPFLDDFANRGFALLQLPPLDAQSSIELLKALGTTGPEDAFADAATEHKGHAFSLELLATYLRETSNGDIRAWREILRFAADDDPLAPSAMSRLLRAYEEHLRGTPELAVLRMLGFFDEPVTTAVLRVLAESPLPVSDSIRGLPSVRVRRAVTRLRDLRIITAAGAAKADILDTHPLVRAYFAKELEAKDRVSWTAGNRKLFEHLAATTEAQPDTLPALGRLYAAMRFACRSGQHREALAIFRDRILRGRLYYSTRVLGALSADLAAMQFLFVSPWDTVGAELDEVDAAWISYEAGFRLRGVGRFREARLAMQQSLSFYRRTKDWANAAKAAGNIAEVLITEGKLDSALRLAREGDGFMAREARASTRDDVPRRLAVRRSTVGYALHQMGRFEDALEVFKEAEAFEETMLSALRGYHYCDLLLDLGRYDEVYERAAHIVDTARRTSIFEEALGIFVMAQLVVTEGDLNHGMRRMEDALSRLRAAAQLHYLPPPMLALAAVCRARGEEARARDLAEDVLEMTQHSPMPLHEIDAHLELARLFLRTSERAAQRHLVAAERLIMRRGYHRRDGAAAELRKNLHG